MGEREGERGKSEKLQVILNQTHTSRYDIMPSFLISKETCIALKCHQRELKKALKPTQSSNEWVIIRLATPQHIITVTLFS